MERKKQHKYWIIIPIIFIIILGVVLYFKNNTTEEKAESVSETEVIRTDILNTLSNSSYITSAIEENKQLHATYYFEEIYFENNQLIKAGENILKYTNGEYLIAPYNCVITNTDLPNSGEICTNQHYITIQSTDTLKITLEIEETELDTIYVGQEARIEVDALQNKMIAGYVTNINQTATYSSSGSKFGVTVEFQNDGEVLLGMSAKCSVVLEKAENTIAVAKEAVAEQNGKKYVTVKLTERTTNIVEVETGIENDAYVEIKSGLNEGDTVLIEESSQSNNQNGMNTRGEMSGEPPEMPSRSLDK